MSMKMDFYYADLDQDRFGKEVKSWRYDKTVHGYAQILGAVSQEALKAGTFFEYHDKLVGRVKRDPRVASDGSSFAITSILVTNIIDSATGVEFYTESVGDRAGKSTLYELLAVEPYVNPWNEIEYYKIMFNRSDRQTMLDA